ncbi:MAG TPA: hypothetical protein VD993_12995 [Chitinophagaceae bacterium]|nr:hypothetical protein [Chitinophagaceae bacterium]
MKHYSKYSKPMRIFLIIIIGTAGFFVFSAVVMWLWNAILPGLLNVGTLTIWQAMGLLVLSKILFSGFGGGGKKRWRDNMPREHWANMSAEEREKFKNEWRSRCWPDRYPQTQATPQQTPQPPADNIQNA